MNNKIKDNIPARTSPGLTRSSFATTRNIFPEGNARWKHDYFEGEQIFISPLCKGNECFIPPGQRFGEFCQMKSFGHLCLQNYYFGTSGGQFHW
jgi:hypothetical protein